MKTNYFKSSLILLFFLTAIIMTSTAQLNPIGEAEQFKGMALSEENGILSKINTINNDLKKNAPTPFYVNTLADKRHGVINNKNFQNKSSSYDYNEHTYLGINIPMSAVTDEMGNTYITGAASNENSAEGNHIAIKIDTNGNQVWETILPGTVYAYEMGIASGLDMNGDFITTGMHWNGLDMDIKTVKYDGTTGAIIWESIHNHSSNALDIPTTMHVDSSGNIAVAGITYANNTINFLTLFYDTNGTLLWSDMDNNSPTNTWNEPTAITTDASGNLYVTGYGAVEGGQGDYWSGYKTLKYDSTGDQLWDKTFLFERLLDETDPNSGMIDTDSMPQSIAVDSAGNCYITGTFDRFGNSRIGTIKYDAPGNEEWVETYRGGATNTNMTNGHDIIHVDNNTIYVGGRHRSGWIDEGIVLISYDENGNQNWTEESLNSIQIATSKLILDNNGLPVIAGLGYDVDSYDSRVRVFRYSDQGVILDETSYFKPQSDTEGVMGMVHLGLDLSDNVFLVMDNFYTATGEVFETVKMHMNSGHNNTDWEVTYDNLFSSATQMLFSTRDNNDNTYVTGRYGQIINNEYVGTFVLTKYNAQGSIDWEKEYNSQNGNDANGIVAKVNSQGEIIVFLLPSTFESSALLKIKKYTAGGDLVWETDKTVHNATLRTFLFDDDDNIYISGSAKEQEPDMAPSFFTAKFSNSGAELWADFAITNDPDDFLFEINAGTINSQGDILLTGTSGFSTMFSEEVDLTVLKYTSNGSLDWMNKYPQTDFISSGFDIITDNLDNMYISGVRQQITIQTEQLLVLKIDELGNEAWTTDYSQTNRLLRPYKIMKDSDGDLITTSSSLYWVQGEPTNNKINTVKFDETDGAIEWSSDTEIDRFYADSYMDANDDVYILNQVQSSALPHRPGSRIEGGLFKISSDGTSTEELFTAPELAYFFPASLTPLNNGTLLLGGDITQEIRFFSGFYFFESSHNPLSIDDHQQTGDKEENWLGQNYPNPVLNTTQIPFYLTSAAQVKLTLFDNQGRLLFEIENAPYPKGRNTVSLNRTGLTTGIYFYQIETGNFKYARKLIVK